MTSFVAKKVSDNHYDLHEVHTGLPAICPASNFGRAMRVHFKGDVRWYLRGNGGHYDARLDETTMFPSLKAALASARKAVEAHNDYMAEEAAAEQQAENAWLRAAETPTWRMMAEQDYEDRREAAMRGWA